MGFQWNVMVPPESYSLDLSNGYLWGFNVILNFMILVDQRMLHMERPLWHLGGSYKRVTKSGATKRDMVNHNVRFDSLVVIVAT